MSRFVALVAVLLVVGTLPMVSAAPLASYDLVGEDPAGDARQWFVTGVSDPAAVFGTGKFDILSLVMGADATALHAKLLVPSSYSGSSSILFVVHFTAGGTKYFTCWNIQSVGASGNSADVPTGEDMSSMACSRITGETRVGPGTRAAGLEYAQEEGGWGIRWEVALEAIGGAADVTDVYAETYVRSVSTCCPPSTAPQSQYVWNLADRAPDAGVWSYAAGGGVPPLALSFAMEPKNATVGPSDSVSVSLMPNLTGNGSVAFNWSVVGLPDGWNGTFDVPNGTLTAGENVTHNLTIFVPEGAENQTTNVTVTLTTEQNLTASANFTITVDALLAPPPLTNSSAPTSSIASDNATAASADGKGIPNLGLVVSTVALLAVATAVRSRRKN